MSLARPLPPAAFFALSLSLFACSGADFAVSGVGDGDTGGEVETDSDRADGDTLSDTGEPADVGPDTLAPDTAIADSGALPDTGKTDSGLLPDTGPLDTGAADTGVVTPDGATGQPHVASVSNSDVCVGKAVTFTIYGANLSATTLATQKGCTLASGDPATNVPTIGTSGKRTFTCTPAIAGSPMEFSVTDAPGVIFTTTFTFYSGIGC